jgi:hypothetical protein
MMRRAFEAMRGHPTTRGSILLPCGHELPLPANIPLTVLPGPVYAHLSACAVAAQERVVANDTEAEGRELPRLGANWWIPQGRR